MPTGSKIVQKLREVEAALATGSTVPQAVRQIGISEQTYYRWRKLYRKKKSPVVALGLSLGVPIGLVIGLVLSYVAMFALTYNIGNPFLTFGVPLLGSPLVLLDGSGQFYNGQVGKGFWFLGLGLGFYVLIFAVLGWGPAVIFVGVLARLTSYVWASVDAYRSAKRINVERGWTINVPGGRRFWLRR